MRRTLACTGIFVLAAGCGAEAPSEVGTAREAAVGTTSEALSAPSGHGHSCGDHEDEDSQEAREHAAIPVSWSRRSPSRRPSRPRSSASTTSTGSSPRGAWSAAARSAARRSSRPTSRPASAGFEGRSLIIHAGDHVGASPPESALLQDEPAIEFLNLLANDSCKGARNALRDPRRGRTTRAATSSGRSATTSSTRARASSSGSFTAGATRTARISRTPGAAPSSPT